jgi:hypothetical protein
VIYEEVQDPRSISLLVSADAGSASEARHAMRRFLERHGVAPARINDAELLTTELVGSAVDRSDDEVDLFARIEGSTMRLWVSDLAGLAARRRGVPAPPHDEWGLQVIHTLASAWGVRRRADGRAGSTIWADLALSGPVGAKPREGRSPGARGRRRRRWLRR